jgi:peptidoglycan/LPS O-acetylase OafA/YrhL
LGGKDNDKYKRAKKNSKNPVKKRFIFYKPLCISFHLMKKQLPELTGIRAILAYTIFFNHFQIPERYTGSFFQPVFNELYIGVSFFFVLSGFLITYRYHHSITTKAFSFKKYLFNRFARIYPMFFLLTVSSILYYRNDLSAIAFDKHSFKAILLNLLLLKAFFKDFILTGIPQGWTLTVEETFYLLAPLLIIMVRKSFLISVLISYTIAALLFFIFHRISFYGFFNDILFIFTKTFFGRCIEFFAGIYLAILVKRHQFNDQNTKGFTFIGLVLLIIFFVVQIQIKGSQAQAIFTFEGAIFHNLFVSLPICLLYAGLIYERTWISKMLSTRLFVLLGKSSYSFYLIHMGFIEHFVRTNFTHNYLLNFPILILISILLYLYVENPINQKLRNQFSKKNQRKCSPELLKV